MFTLQFNFKSSKFGWLVQWFSIDFLLIGLKKIFSSVAITLLSFADVRWKCGGII